MTSTTQDTRSYAELEESARDGEIVTAEELSQARERDRLLELRRDAELRKRQAVELAEHEAELERLRADIAALDSADALIQKSRRAVAALVELVAAVQGREPAIRSLAARARALRVSQMDTDNVAHGAVGWRATGTGDLLLSVDGRLLRSGDANKLIGSVIREVRAVAGVTEARTPNPVQAGPLDELLASLDYRPAPPEEKSVQVRYIPGRSGKSGFEMVTPARAASLVRRGLAEPVA